MQRTTLTEDERYELLANAVRRETLSILQRVGAPVTLTDVAQTVWATSDVGERTSGLQRVKIELHHNHLPKLSKYGLVEYESSQQRIVENHVDGDVFGAE